MDTLIQQNANERPWPPNHYLARSQAQELTFNNTTPHPCKVCWIVGDNDERVYRILQPGESYTQATLPGQRWQMRQILRREIGRVIHSPAQEGDARKFVFFDLDDGEDTLTDQPASPAAVPATAGALDNTGAYSTHPVLAGVPLLNQLAVGKSSFLPNVAGEMAGEYPLYGSLALTGGNDILLGFLRDVLQLERLPLQGWITASGGVVHAFSLSTYIEGDFALFKTNTLSLKVPRMMLTLSLGGQPPEPTVRVDLLGELETADKGGGQGLVMQTNGSLIAQVESISAALTVSPRPEWREPFGIPGLVLRNLAVEAGLSYISPFVDNVGVVGDLQLAEISGVVALKIDANDPDQFVVAGFIRQITLTQLITAALPLGLPTLQLIPAGIRHSLDTLLNVWILDARINLVPYAQSIGTLQFEPGFFFGGTISLWGWRARTWIKCDLFERGSLSLMAEFDPISLLGGIIRITRSAGDEGEAWAEPPPLLNGPPITPAANPGTNNASEEPEENTPLGGARLYFSIATGSEAPGVESSAVPTVPANSTVASGFDPASMNDLPVELGLSARVQILLLHADVYAQLTERGFEFDFDAGIPDLAEARLHCVYRGNEFIAEGNLRLSLFFTVMPLIAVPVVAGVPLIGRLVFNALGFTAQIAIAAQAQPARQFALRLKGKLTVLGMDMDLPPLHLATQPTQGVNQLQAAVANQIGPMIARDTNGILSTLLDQAEAWARAVVEGVVEFFGDPVIALKDYFQQTAEQAARILKRIFNYGIGLIAKALLETYRLAEEAIKAILAAIGFLVEEVVAFFSAPADSDRPAPKALAATT